MTRTNVQRTWTARKDLKIGQRIRAKMHIDGTLLIPKPGKSSNTRKRILGGKKVQKLAYVLQIREQYITVAYATTFGETTDIANEVVDVDDWYNALDGWIYIGPTIKVTDENIEAEDVTLSPEELEELRERMSRRAKFKAGKDQDQEVEEASGEAPEGPISGVPPARGDLTPPNAAASHLSDANGIVPN
ncbi:hypothetical protein FRC06_008550 [Ceratobasidium sp. 370]|nr:hypothetical protein FRC06_008550 [Ceratobasidium sp. 370]